MSGIMLIRMNRTDKIKTTAVVNADMGFSFLRYSIYLYVDTADLVPFYMLKPWKIRIDAYKFQTKSALPGAVALYPHSPSPRGSG